MDCRSGRRPTSRWRYCLRFLATLGSRPGVHDPASGGFAAKLLTPIIALHSIFPPQTRLRGKTKKVPSATPSGRTERWSLAGVLPRFLLTLAADGGSPAYCQVWRGMWNETRRRDLRMVASFLHRLRLLRLFPPDPAMTARDALVADRVARVKVTASPRNHLSGAAFSDALCVAALR